MCRPVTCKKCGKTTWAGCGNHVDQVMRNVPKGERCSCRADVGSSVGAQAGGSGWLGKLFGRK